MCDYTGLQYQPCPHDALTGGIAMPLVRIDLVRGRTEQEVRAVADAVHAALVDVVGIPADDRSR
jgi:hypothetical protein